MIRDELVPMFEGVLRYHGIGLRGVDAGEAFDLAATELGFPGYTGGEPANEYATHNYAVPAAGCYATRAGLPIPDAALCDRDRCFRLRIPGFSSCHWHGANAAGDVEILARLRAEIGG